MEILWISVLTDFAFSLNCAATTAIGPKRLYGFQSQPIPHCKKIIQEIRNA